MGESSPSPPPSSNRMLVTVLTGCDVIRASSTETRSPDARFISRSLLSSHRIDDRVQSAGHTPCPALEAGVQSRRKVCLKPPGSVLCAKYMTVPFPFFPREKSSCCIPWRFRWPCRPERLRRGPLKTQSFLAAQRTPPI